MQRERLPRFLSSLFEQPRAIRTPRSSSPLVSWMSKRFQVLRQRRLPPCNNSLADRVSACSWSVFKAIRMHTLLSIPAAAGEPQIISRGSTTPKGAVPSRRSSSVLVDCEDESWNATPSRIQQTVRPRWWCGLGSAGTS